MESLLDKNSSNVILSKDLLMIALYGKLYYKLNNIQWNVQ